MSKSLFLKNKYAILLTRLIIVYMTYALCRLMFFWHNDDLLDDLSGYFDLFKGSLLFDTVSILYTNALFIVLSMLPVKTQGNRFYDNLIFISFFISNALGLLVNVVDIFYYPFKHSRIVVSDFAIITHENLWGLVPDLLLDFWYGFLLYIILLYVLYKGFKIIRLQNDSLYTKHPYLLQTTYLVVVVGIIVFFIRGASFSAATFPISMNDAFLYTKNASHTSLILSNPFCLLRTFGKSDAVPNLHYFENETASQLSPTTHVASGTKTFELPAKTNIFLIVLESFGSAHIKGMSDQFPPGHQSYTPFLDSLIGQSYVFTNAYQNGSRSIDALPAIWASIPSFKDHFLSYPNSVAKYRALPEILSKKGYTTSFFHGSVRESMGFVSFGKAAGVHSFYTREDYELENGDADFDGKWGIWDHKFFPYVHRKINMIADNRPFFATLFTLSSHHPFKLPSDVKEHFPQGKLPIHKTIAYSDYALQEFFRSISHEPWFNNTLFVITADHSSGADNEKYSKQPYEFSVPILFYNPGSGWRGKDDRIMQHIDIMPTILGMMDYSLPYFAFGNNHFEYKGATHFALNYSNGAYNCTTDKYTYLFNEKEVIKKIDYRKDPLGNTCLQPDYERDNKLIEGMKAFLQQYSIHLQERDFIPQE